MPSATCVYSKGIVSSTDKDVLYKIFSSSELYLGAFIHLSEEKILQLSVPQRSEGTEVMKITIRSDKCFGVAGMREKCFGVAGVAH